jgi:hypothetical protein
MTASRACSIELGPAYRIAAPQQHDRDIHYCEPRLADLGDGCLVLSHRAGTARASADGRIQLSSSRDSGQSWQVLGRPFDGIETGWDVRRASLARMSSGELVAALLMVDKSSGRALHHPVTEGILPIRNQLSWSQSDGVTWSRPADLVGAPWPQIAVEQLVALPDAILANFETFKDYDDPRPWLYRGGVMRSHDAGRRWHDAVVAAEADPLRDELDTMWWDPRMARLDSGRLVQFYYAYHHARGTEGPVHVAWSDDDGRTWSSPRPTTISGQVSYPVALPNGTLLVVTQRRTDPQGVVVHASVDDGASFGECVDVYRHSEESAVGADGSLDPVSYLLSMQNFTFGHPCAVATSDASALVVWYAGCRERTAIYGRTVRVR